MTIIKISQLINEADKRQAAAGSIATEYENLRIPVGSEWVNAMNSAGVPAATSMALASAMQNRMANVSLAYTEAASDLRQLLELFAEARSAIKKARNGAEQFIID